MRAGLALPPNMNFASKTNDIAIMRLAYPDRANSFDGVIEELDK